MSQRLVALANIIEPLASSVIVDNHKSRYEFNGRDAHQDSFVWRTSVPARGMATGEGGQEFDRRRASSSGEASCCHVLLGRLHHDPHQSLY